MNSITEKFKSNRRLINIAKFVLIFIILKAISWVLAQFIFMIPIYIFQIPYFIISDYTLICTIIIMVCILAKERIGREKIADLELSESGDLIANEELTEMKFMRKKILNTKLIGNIILLPAVPLIIYCFISQNTAVVIITNILMLVGIYVRIVTVSSLSKEYSAKFKSAFVLPELKKNFDNLTYEPDKFFGYDMYNFAGVFEDINSIWGNDFTEADYRGIHFQMSDSRADEITTHTYQDKDGNTKTKEKIRKIFSGKVFSFKSKENYRDAIYILKKDFKNTAFNKSISDIFKKNSYQDMEKISTELDNFNQRFNIFSDNPQEAMRVLTPQAIESIFYVDNLMNKPLMFIFKESSIYIFIDYLGEDTFDASTKRTPSEEKRKLQIDINLIKGFLETMYFKK